MSLIANLHCTHCDLNGARLTHGLGEAGYWEIHYCADCTRLRNFSSNRHRSDDVRLVARRGIRCHLDHTLVGPIRPDLQAPIHCPRCQHPTLHTECFAIGD